ncbi:MAG: glutamate-5-semialdehyde dehydrogenase, partial [Blastocatellia bacterium]
MKVETESIGGRIIELARRAKSAARLMSQISTGQKDIALANIAARLRESSSAIFRKNVDDLDRARPLVESGKMADPLYKRLKLDTQKLSDIIGGVEQVAALDDPVGKISLATELDDGLNLYRVNCPIGVIGVIFESRPDALVQISSLALKSGNAVLLKGGSEAESTNRALFDVIQAAVVESGIPADALTLLESREDVTALL